MHASLGCKARAPLHSLDNGKLTYLLYLLTYLLSMKREFVLLTYLLYLLTYLLLVPMTGNGSPGDPFLHASLGCKTFYLLTYYSIASPRQHNGIAIYVIFKAGNIRMITTGWMIAPSEMIIYYFNLFIINSEKNI